MGVGCDVVQGDDEVVLGWIGAHEGDADGEVVARMNGGLGFAGDEGLGGLGWVALDEGGLEPFRRVDLGLGFAVFEREGGAQGGVVDGELGEGAEEFWNVERTFDVEDLGDVVCGALMADVVDEG